MRKIEFILFLVLFLVFFQGKVLSVTTTIVDYPSIVTNNSFTIKVLVEGASAGQNYLRIDLYKEGSTSYFGETFNGIEWYFGSDGKNYLPITIESGKSASASVQVRLGTPSSSDFLGVGEYKMKVRRYTSSGNQGNDTTSPVSIVINVPSQTPSPVPTQTPTNTPTPTQTKTPTVTKTPTATKSVSPTKTPSPTKTKDPTPVQEVLAERITPSPTVGVKVKSTNAKDNLLSVIFIGLGFVFMLACVIFSFLAFRKYQTRYE